MITVTTGVQYLHTNFAALGVYRIGDDFVLPGFFFVAHFCAERADPTLAIGCNTARHDECDTAARPLGKINGLFFKTVFGFFQSRVHGTHEHSVFKSGKAQIERFE